MARDIPVADSSRSVAPAVPTRRTRVLLYVQIAGVLLAVVAVLVPTGWLPDWRGQPAATPVSAGVTRQSAAPVPGGTPGLPMFEQRQVVVNRTLFPEALVAFAGSWLPWLSGCTSSRNPGGPQLREGERARVSCWYGNVAVHFVEYVSIADRKRYRDQAIDGNRVAKELAPGVLDPAEKSGTSGLTSGVYAEYAYATDVDDQQARTVAGLWWDGGPETTAAGYLLGYWYEDFGQSWDSLREVWRRNS